MLQNYEILRIGFEEPGPCELRIFHPGKPMQSWKWYVNGDPIDLAFDGTNIWVTNFTTNQITELRATDGTKLGEFAADMQVHVVNDGPVTMPLQMSA